ncbi:MAG TPA: hypothetical protein VF209_01630 [Patescibacteria group bacterium]
MPNLYEICSEKNIFDPNKPTNPGEYGRCVAVTGWEHFEPLLKREITRRQSDDFSIRIMSDNRSVVLSAKDFLQVVQPLTPVDVEVFTANLFKKD